MIKKVIRASAGTGKTYRLSLEYVALLLRYREAGIHFSEILVITFTKKATAEIRERIFRHLQQLTTHSDEGKTLRQNLAAISGSALTEAQLRYLTKVYQEMLTEKNRVQISTIDAFTHQIFKTVIAPYLGLTNFTIDPQAYQDYLAELYEFILEPNHLTKIKELFERSGHRNLQGYETLIKDILDKRWIFPLIQDCRLPLEGDQAESHLHQFQQVFRQVYTEVQPLLAQKCASESPAKVIKSEFYKAIAKPRTADLESWNRCVENRLQDIPFLKKNAKLFMDGDPFWNGVKILNGAKNAEQRTRLTEQLQRAGSHLADYLYATDFLQEQAQLQEISQLLLHKYDEILFREKRFNYSDVLYHTYRHLYDPELSLIQGDEVSNTFYEILTTRIRFLLIDEFQDTSILQFKLFLPIIKEITSGQGIKSYGGVIVVGDEKQSIYGWRGGERDFILRMPEIIPDSEGLQLTTSYRHSPTVMNFVNTTFGDPELARCLALAKVDWPYQPCQTEQTGEGSVTLRLHNQADEDDVVTDQEWSPAETFVKSMIKPMLDQGCMQPGRTAVLARRNLDLTALANAMDELGIDYVLESSRSIFDHRAIKPLLFLFRFLVYQDILELVKFLRSDLVRMEGIALKEVMQCYDRHRVASSSDQSFLSALRENCGHFPAIARIIDWVTNHEKFDLFDLCLQAVAMFQLTTFFPLEADLINIHLFLEIVAGFSQRYALYPPTIQGLLRFAEEHEEDENLAQLGMEQANAIRLLTIHKSKGLEFDSVFLYWDVPAKEKNQWNRLHTFIQHSHDYGLVEDFALAYNLKDLLTYSHRRPLIEEERKKNMIEALNGFYVAMTRPKNDLILFCTYKKKGGLQAYLDSLADLAEPSASQVLFKTMIARILAEPDWRKSNDPVAEWQIGRLRSTETIEPVVTEKNDKWGVEFWNAERRRYLYRDPEKAVREAFIDFKSMYLKKRSADRGTIVHHYLSHLQYGSEDERRRGRELTISRYGLLLPSKEIHRLLDQVDRFILAACGEFFAESWKVFTEQTIYGPNGEELRIDRLLVDERARRIVIVDFKTGEQVEESQMAAYVQAVCLLPIVQQGGYSVVGQFIEIKIE